MPNNAVWQTALARTLSLASYALTAAGRAHDAKADAQRAWSGAFAAVDSVTRATGVAELRVLTATALASLGRVEDARPIVRTLEQQGYRRPRWLARTRAAGLLPQQ